MPETSIWNDYWHYDRLSSFDDAETNYREEVAGEWRSFFDSLPNGASILDLCTGNGAIAVMAAESSRRFVDRLAVQGVPTFSSFLQFNRHRTVCRKMWGHIL